MKLISMQSRGNLLAKVFRVAGNQHHVDIKVFAHWCQRFLDFVSAECESEASALNLVNLQLGTYGGGYDANT